MEEELKSNFGSLDPASLLQLLNRYVRVQLQNAAFEGFIRSIDPLSHSVILSVPKEGAYQTTVIPGYAIKDITEILSELEPPRQEIPAKVQNEYSSDRKNKLINWFKRNLLPVSEVDDQIIVGGATVMPPYSVTNIYTNNVVVVTQIRKLMEQMPVDFV